MRRRPLFGAAFRYGVREIGQQVTGLHAEAAGQLFDRLQLRRAVFLLKEIHVRPVETAPCRQPLLR